MNHRRKIDELSSALPLEIHRRNGFYYMLFLLPVKTKYFIYVDSFKISVLNLEITEFDH